MNFILSSHFDEVIFCFNGPAIGHLIIQYFFWERLFCLESLVLDWIRTKFSGIIIGEFYIRQSFW